MGLCCASNSSRNQEIRQKLLEIQNRVNELNAIPESKWSEVDKQFMALVLNDDFKRYYQKNMQQ